MDEVSVGNGMSILMMARTVCVWLTVCERLGLPRQRIQHLKAEFGGVPSLEAIEEVSALYVETSARWHAARDCMVEMYIRKLKEGSCQRTR